MKKKIYKAFVLCMALGMTASALNFTVIAAPTSNLEKPVLSDEKVITAGGIKYTISVTPTSKFNGRATVADNRDCTVTDIVIPNKINYNGSEYDITEISEKAFCENNVIKTVSIGKNVKKIASDSFAACQGLAKIDVDRENLYYRSEDDILYSFDRSTILCCPIDKKIKSFNVPASVKAIGDFAFYGNDKLYNINFPTELREIGDYAFANCSSLSRISAMSKLERIGDYAFAQSGLSAIGLTSSLKEMGDGAFLGSQLKSIRIPASIEEIPYGAFYNCTGLKSVIIGDNVKTIDDFAFSGTAITEILMPAKVTNVNYAAFCNCENLISVKLNNTKAIGDAAFSGCKSIIDFTITKNVQSVGKEVFVGCDSLKNIIVEAGNQKYTDIGGILYNKGITTLIKYPSNNFSNSYELPANINIIEDGALDGCRYISEFTVADGNAWFSAENGVLYDFDKNVLVMYPIAKNSANFDVPDRIRKISAHAFENSYISGCINIPAHVTEIGENAFAGCKKVSMYNVHSDNKNFKTENGVLFSIDGKSIIQYPAAALNLSYKIPEGVTTIGASAFKYSALTEIKLPKTVSKIKKEAFSNTAITEITLPEGLAEIGESAFDASELLKINIPSTVNSIGDCAFASCPRLYEVTFNNVNGISSTGFDVFTGSDNLKNIYVPMGTYSDYKNSLIEMDVENYEEMLSEKK